MLNSTELLTKALEKLRLYSKDGLLYPNLEDQIESYLQSCSKSNEFLETNMLDCFPCKTHPNAPHGFNRDVSHCLNRYVCDCENWEPEDEH